MQRVNPLPYPDLAPQRRAADLVSRMTLEEKVLQMQSSAPAIPRLNVPAFNWWNEALRCRPGTSHSVPTGDRTCGHLGYRTDDNVADMISTEARAKYNVAQVAHLLSSASRPLRLARSYRLIDLLVAEHQHLPRSPLGTRAGDVRGRSISHQPNGCRIRQGPAGQRSSLP